MTFSTRNATPLLGLATLAALGLAAAPAHAQSTIMQYSSQASFNAATSGLTTFTFDGYAPKGSSSYYPKGLKVDGVTFADSGNALFVDDPAVGFENPFNGSQFLESDSQLNVALPTGTTAFGAKFSNLFSSSGSTITAVVNGQKFTFADPGDTTSAFAGFTSLLPITSLSFSGGNNAVALDNVSVGNGFAAPAAVPEASTTISFGLLLALGGLAAVAHKRKAAVSAN